MLFTHLCMIIQNARISCLWETLEMLVYLFYSSCYAYLILGLLLMTSSPTRYVGIKRASALGTPVNFLAIEKNNIKNVNKICYDILSSPRARYMRIRAYDGRTKVEEQKMYGWLWATLCKTLMRNKEGYFFCTTFLLWTWHSLLLYIIRIVFKIIL